MAGLANEHDFEVWVGEMGQLGRKVQLPAEVARSGEMPSMMWLLLDVLEQKMSAAAGSGTSSGQIRPSPALHSALEIPEHLDWTCSRCFARDEKVAGRKKRG